MLFPFFFVDKSFFNDFCRIATNDGAGWYVLSYHCARCHDSPITDCYTSKDNCSMTNPYI